MFPTGLALTLIHLGIFSDELIPVLNGCDLDAYDDAFLGISLDDLLTLGLHISYLMSLAVVEFAQSMLPFAVVVAADGGDGIDSNKCQYGGGASNVFDHVL